MTDESGDHDYLINVLTGKILTQKGDDDDNDIFDGDEYVFIKEYKVHLKKFGPKEKEEVASLKRYGTHIPKANAEKHFPTWPKI